MNTGGGYAILTGPKVMQVERIHRWLNECSHWSQGIPFSTVEAMVKNSFCVGVFYYGEQIGFARLITDYTAIAYLADVYIEEDHRGRDLSKRMMEAIMSEPWVKNLRRLFLSTKDAHSLYAQYGFTPIRYPERMMEILHIDQYKQNKT
jgi:N-acetylglutamate synthase-like GNAT family acetyltransferase